MSKAPRQNKYPCSRFLTQRPLGSDRFGHMERQRPYYSIRLELNNFAFTASSFQPNPNLWRDVDVDSSIVYLTADMSSSSSRADHTTFAKTSLLPRQLVHQI